MKRRSQSSDRTPAGLGLTGLAADIAQGLLEAIAHTRGDLKCRETTIVVPDPPPSYSKEMVASIRKELGFTQLQFARLMNVSPQSVSGWERGTRGIPGSSLRLLQFLSSPGAFEEIVDQRRRGRPGSSRTGRRTSARSARIRTAQ